MSRRSSVGCRWVLTVLAVLAASGCAWTRPEDPEPPTPPAAPAVAAAPAPSTCVTAPIVLNGSRQRRRIALTFDACTTHKNEYDERVIRTLMETNTPATLFVGGGWAEANAQRLQELARHPGFEFGNHTFSHAHMTQLKEDARVLEEFQRTQRAVYDLTGQVPRYFRPPFGEVDSRVAWIASRAALTTINFDLPSGDPDENTTAQRVVDWVLKKASPGGIVVMHMNHKRFPTAEALPAVIKGLRKRGFELVTVGALLDESADAPPPLCAPSPTPAGPPLLAEITP